MKHQVKRIDNLMYKGCEPHWKCKICGACIPFHCYTKEQLEEQECHNIVIKICTYSETGCGSCAVPEEMKECQK